MISRFQAGVLFALAAATALGAITTQAKIVYILGGNALTVMLIRFVSTALITGCIVAGRRYWSSGQPVSGAGRGQLRLTLITGVAWSAGMICYLLSVQTVPVSIAALLFYTYPLMVLGVSVAAGNVRLSAALGALFLAAFVGLGLALLNGEIILELKGVALALLAAVGATLTFFIGARVARQVDPFTLTFRVSVIGLVMILPFAQGHIAFPDGTGLVALGGATACYIIGILCQFAALSRLAPASAAFILNFEPVVSILLASGFLGELLSWRQWLGVSLVLLALLASTWIRESRGMN